MDLQEQGSHAVLNNESTAAALLNNESTAAALLNIAPPAQATRLFAVPDLDAQLEHDEGPEDNQARPFELTIVVPVYNEVKTAARVVGRLLNLELPTPVNVLAIDDGSSDGTTDVLLAMDHPRLRVIKHDSNCGKGRAVLTGLEHAMGSHVLVFDADTEYDPEDITRAVGPLLTGRAEVVYGSRMSGFGTVHPTFTHLVGNRLMTLATNILYGVAISDLHTCVKIVPTPLLRVLDLTESGFALDTEISAELLRHGFRPYEIPISYVGRSKQEGKKIRFSDSIRCIYVLLKVRLRPRTKYGCRDRSLTPRTYIPQPPPSSTE